MISVDVFLGFKPGIGKLDGMVDEYQHLLALHNILHKGNTEGIGMLLLCVFTFISLYNVYEFMCFT